MGDVHFPFNGDTLGGLPSPPADTQKGSDLNGDWASTVVAGCLEDNEQEDCICPSCTDRYQVSSFYLEVMVSDQTDIGKVQEAVQRVVGKTAVRFPMDTGVGLSLCGYYWDSLPGYRRVVVMASMDAKCVCRTLYAGLVSELDSLRCEAAPQVVVDVAGYGPRGQSTSVSTLMFWHGLCLQRAWPDVPPVRAERFGDPHDHVSRWRIERKCLDAYRSVSDMTSTTSSAHWPVK